jgi:AmmeMemoRadiSam system protein B
MPLTRMPAVAGRFYPDDPAQLSQMVDEMLNEAGGDPRPAFGGIVPHAGLVYSGACAAHVFNRMASGDVTVILAPNHTGRWDNWGGAGTWNSGSFLTPLGPVEVSEGFVSRLEHECELVAHDFAAHQFEHAVEVELPFLKRVAPESQLVPLVLAWDDWDRCEVLATALARVVAEWSGRVVLLASSDMTHYETADSAASKDRKALTEVERLDGAALLDVCKRENVTMCGRAPAAVVLEASRQLKAERGEVVDYRHSGLVSGDDASVVAYAGVLIT